MGLFNNLKGKQEKKETSKKDSGTAITIENDAEGFELLFQYAQLNQQKKGLEAKIKTFYNGVKTNLINQFTKLYEEKGENPNTFDVIYQMTEKGKVVGEVMTKFIPTDGYKKIEKEQAEELREKFGKDVVEEVDTVTVNTELFQKYESLFEKFLKENKQIPDEDKEKIFGVDTTYRIKEKAVDDLPAFQKEYRNKTKHFISLNDVIEQLGVIFQIKDPKVTVEPKSDEEKSLTIKPSTKDKKARTTA